MAEITTREYWDKRYRAGQTSGAGSYGKLGLFKAEIINDFAEKHNVKTAVELGCGDGNQLSLFRFESYLGLDISPTAIDLCRQKYAGDGSKSFAVYPSESIGLKIARKAELALSLDVIYHLLEDNLYQNYLIDLFQLASRFVIVYANNTDYQGATGYHIRYHKFTNWVEANRPDWRLAGFLPNRYPFNPDDPEETSISHFYIFSRKSVLDARYAIFQSQGSLPTAKDESGPLGASGAVYEGNGERPSQPNPNAGPVTDPDGHPAPDPNAGPVTGAGGGQVADPNAGPVTDPDSHPTPDPNAGPMTGAGGGQVADPNAGPVTDPENGPVAAKENAPKPAHGLSNLRDLMLEARKSFADRDLDRTKILLGQALSLDPHNQTVLNNLGLIAFSQGQFRENNKIQSLNILK
ncbi:MAG: hypothetical protein LBJ61_11690 [Deltaproteobacteria bacterium]|jgi:hypothetical protein|nr:hypothetical protein [Deltaproteobacteria bacterium]